MPRKNEKNEYDKVKVESNEREWPDLRRGKEAASAAYVFTLEDDDDRQQASD